jgi:uncharacterized membrane protein YdjX (TVP38/TMEM64 family)
MKPHTQAPLKRRIMNVLLLGALLACGVVVYLTPLAGWVREEQAMTAWLASFGPWAPAVYVAGATVLVAAGVPRLLLCSIAGLAFGFTEGLVWSHAGTLLGSYLTFLFVRWSGREWSLDHFPRLQPFTHHLAERGVLTVLLIRQLPMSGFYNNLLLGLTAVSHRDFLWGSFLGFLPMGVTASLLGAGLIQADAATTARYLLLAAICFAVLGFLLKWLMLRWKAAPVALALPSEKP